MNGIKIIKCLISTWTILLNSHLYASSLGHPDNDEVVRSLREAFKSGTVVPDASSLEGIVDCQAFTAYGDDELNYSHEEYSFAESIPGTGFFTLSKYSDEGTTYLSGQYVLSSEGLRYTGTDSYNGDTLVTTYGRLDATGNLIFEGSTLDGTEGRLESIAEPGLFANYYQICFKRK